MEQPALVDERPGDLFTQCRLLGVTEPPHHLVVGRCRVLQFPGISERPALVDQRPGDPFTQYRLLGVTEPPHHLVRGRYRVLQFPGLSERPALVDQRPGDLFTQCRLLGVTEPPDHLVVGRYRVLQFIGLAERRALVDERHGFLSRGRFLRTGRVIESFGRHYVIVVKISVDTHRKPVREHLFGVWLGFGVPCGVSDFFLVTRRDFLLFAFRN